MPATRNGSAMSARSSPPTSTATLRPEERPSRRATPAPPPRQLAPDDDRVGLDDILVVPEFSLDESARGPGDARLGGGIDSRDGDAGRGVVALREGLEADARCGGGDRWIGKHGLCDIRRVGDTGNVRIGGARDDMAEREAEAAVEALRDVAVLQSFEEHEHE